MLNNHRFAIALAAGLAAFRGFSSEIAAALRPHPSHPRPRPTHYHGHNTRGHGVELNHCWRCGKNVNFFKRRKRRKHLCKAPWQPMPRAGWRVQDGVEVRSG